MTQDKTIEEPEVETARLTDKLHPRKTASMQWAAPSSGRVHFEEAITAPAFGVHGFRPDTTTIYYAGHAEITRQVQQYIPINLAGELETMQRQIIDLTATVAGLSEQIENLSSVTSLLIYELGSDAYELKYPISVIVEESDDEAAARWAEVRAYGLGDTLAEAIADLKHHIIQLYEDLSRRDPEELGQIAKATLRTLNTYIAPRNGL